MSDMLSKLSIPMKIVLAGGLVLLIDTFLPWQRACGSVGGSSLCVSRNGWHGFGVIVGLLVIALLCWEILRLAGIKIRLPLHHSLVSACIGAALVLFTVIKIFDDSEFRAYGSWLGLVLAIVVGIGAWMGLQEGGIARRSQPTAG